MASFDLSRLPDQQLETLVARLGQTSAAVLTKEMLAFIGLGAQATPIWEAFGPVHIDAAMAAARAVLAERARRPPEPQFVWSGDDRREDSEARDAEIVLGELFTHVQKDLLLTGYSLYGKQLFAPLRKRMREGDIRARFFLNFEQQEKWTDGQKEAAPLSVTDIERQAQEILDNNWDTRTPIPEIYYDSRLSQGGVFCSVHAKCIVVDEETSLVTSANLTKRGHDRNIEVGVRLDNPIFARQVTAHFNALVQHGRFVLLSL